MVRGRENAVRRSFYSKTLSHTATSLPLEQRFDHNVGEAAVRAGFRRALFYLAKNTRSVVPAAGQQAAQNYKSPVFPLHPQGAHSGEGYNADAAAAPLDQRYNDLLGELFPNNAHRPAVGNLDIPIDRQYYNRGWSSVCSMNRGGNIDMYSIDAAWFARFSSWNLSSLTAFRRQLARLTNSEAIDFVAWTFVLDLEMGMQANANRLSFGARYRGGNAGDAANQVYNAAHDVDFVDSSPNFPQAVNVPRVAVPAAGDQLEVSLIKLQASYYTPKHHFLPVANFQEDAHYTIPAGLNLFKNVTFKQPIPAETIAAQNFAMAYSQTSGDALDLYDFMLLTGVRVCADVGVSDVGLTRSLALMANKEIDTGSSQLDQLIPRSNAMNVGISMSAIESGLLRAAADMEETFGIANNLFDEVSAGKTSVQLYRPFIVNSTASGDALTLHQMPYCSIPEVFEYMAPGTALVSTNFNTRSDWYKASTPGAKNFSANFEFSEFNAGEFFGFTKKLYAHVGLGYRVEAKVEYVEAAVSNVPFHVTLDEEWSQLFPRRPDYCPYSDGSMVDHLQLTNYILGVKWFEHQSAARPDGIAVNAADNARRSSSAALLPIEMLSPLVDINPFGGHLPMQCYYWGPNAEIFADTAQQTYRPALGRNYANEPNANVWDGGRWDVTNIVIAERPGKKSLASRIQPMKITLNLPNLAGNNVNPINIMAGARRLSASPSIPAPEHANEDQPAQFNQDEQQTGVRTT